MKSNAATRRATIAICTLFALTALAAGRDTLAPRVTRFVAHAIAGNAHTISDEIADDEAQSRHPTRREGESSIDRVRARAEAAFAEMPPGRKSRSTSRIGPQPWPADLPEAFPRPPAARVLADTTREGDRLLLVDLPTPVDRAAEDFDRALRDHGYAVAHADTRRVPHALHASDASGDAVLTFLARADATRVEILFLSGSESGGTRVRGG